MKKICLNNRTIGRRCPAFIIAEAGVNHDGSLEQAMRLVEIAAQAHADAVKFQSFTAERLVTASAPKAAYQKTAGTSHESQLDMLRRLELSIEDHCKLAQHCRQNGIEFLSTPFDEIWTDVLDELGVAAFKIGSGELTNLPFLSHVAAKGKPMIISTGMAGLEEVEQAVTTVRAAGASEIVLLQCTSAYPASAETVNMNAMQTLRRRFGVWTGLSDHTNGIEIAIGAAALGASVIEKHFTLDRSLAGPDHRMSLEPLELAAMIYAIRNVERAMGDGKKTPCANETETAQVARRSLVAARDIGIGDIIDAAAVAIQRPGTGLPACKMSAIIGLRAKASIPKGMLLAMEMLEVSG
ncbi:MAG: N-acetylneuraminate synthase [bacterium]